MARHNSERQLQSSTHTQYYERTGTQIPASCTGGDSLLRHIRPPESNEHFDVFQDLVMMDGLDAPEELDLGKAISLEYRVGYQTTHLNDGNRLLETLD